uniref:Uncharacterized protein n=1 Tax=Caenorhabditis tropicalis TaxID=1561998 RepID=A0A1I7TSA5_9PELO
MEKINWIKLRSWGNMDTFVQSKSQEAMFRKNHIQVYLNLNSDIINNGVSRRIGYAPSVILGNSTTSLR